MCGISVSIALDRRQRQPCTPETRADLETKLSNSLDLIAHRGPDAKGIWINEDASIGLGHNRLSINDLSPAANQPHHSPCNQIHAVINGEIYDPEDRRRNHLTTTYNYTFQSHTDTELVLALYQAHGSPSFLNPLRGEFSLVLYDAREGSNKVVLARDRFGIKPLFWTVTQDGRLLAAAETKAFLALGWVPRWDVGAIVQAAWQVGERTLFEGVRKVVPGGWMGVGPDGGMVEGRYWDLAYPDKRVPETRSVEEMVLGVRERLTEAVRLRLRADVPVGIYLSGGIDSSLVAGIATHLVRDEGIKMGNQDATSRICCFSIEFPDSPAFDESDIAERTANWLGVQILKQRMDEKALAENLADTAYHSEQHSMDVNAVGKFCLSKLPREHGFKVVLTGEGSDEHFAGYSFFIPDMLREPDLAMPELLMARDPELRAGLQDKTQRTMEAGILSWSGPIQRVGDPEAYRELNGVRLLSWARAWQPPLNIFAPQLRERWAAVSSERAQTQQIPADAKEKMMTTWHPLHSSEYLWAKSQLVNNLLVCLGDRTEMAHSIEARPPFLDHVLSEYVNALPPSVKLAYTPDAESASKKSATPWGSSGTITNSFTEKWILREAGKPYITTELYERRKQPYFAPNKWPKDGPIHRKLREICTQEAVEKLGFVDWEVVRNALDSAFGEDADNTAFRVLLVIGGWVTIGERFGIQRAELGV